MGKEKILAALHSFREEMVRKGQFTLSELQDRMEPIFCESDYRKEQPVGRMKILILHDAGVGDFVNLSPALKYVKQLYPEAELSLLCNPGSVSLAQSCPLLAQTLSADLQRINFPMDALALYDADMRYASQLLDLQFDMAICFAHYGNTLLLAYMTGAAQRLGYAYDGTPCPFLSGVIPHKAAAVLLTTKVPFRFATAVGHHIADYYLGILEGASGQQMADRSLELWLLSDDMEQVSRAVSFKDKKKFPVRDFRYCAVCVGGTRRGNHWPIAKYSELLKKLSIRDKNFRFLILGGPQDREAAEQICSEAGRKHACNLAGMLSYRASAMAVTQCSLYIGNDTGIMHLAAAAHIPVLSPNCYPASKYITKDSTPYAYRPYGVPTVLAVPEEAMADCAGSAESHGCAHNFDAHCITQIGVETMLKGLEVLEERAARQEMDLALLAGDATRGFSLRTMGIGHGYGADSVGPENDIFLKLYDTTRRSMRPYNKIMPITRDAYALELQENLAGKWADVNYLDFKDISDYDFFQMIAMRLFRRVPTEYEIEQFRKADHSQIGNYKLNYLREIQEKYFKAKNR